MPGVSALTLPLAPFASRLAGAQAVRTGVSSSATDFTLSIEELNALPECDED